MPGDTMAYGRRRCDHERYNAMTVWAPCAQCVIRTTSPIPALTHPSHTPDLHTQPKPILHKGTELRWVWALGPTVCAHEWYHAGNNNER